MLSIICKFFLGCLFFFLCVCAGILDMLYRIIVSLGKLLGILEEKIISIMENIDNYIDK